MQFIGPILAILISLTWSYALWFIPEDIHQGEVYRILYVHVPMAFSAFFSAFLLLMGSLVSLKSENSIGFRWARASAELGLIFTILTLVTGSIWGKPTWGTYWTWDARLTTTFILAILLAAYLLVSSQLSMSTQKNKICAFLGIMIFIDVPIIYKSVSWWRTLHQPPSLMTKDSPVSTEIFNLLTGSMLLVLLLSLWLTYMRYQNLKIRDQIESFQGD